MSNTKQNDLLHPGFSLSLRPMKYAEFYDMVGMAEKNTWTVEEVDFSTDLVDLRTKISGAEKHMIQRLVAFFATGDSIVSNNLVLNLYTHLNSPEARLYLSRQLWEEALHVKFYLTLLDNYIPDHAERNAAFAAVDNIPSIQKKAEFAAKWIDSISEMKEIRTDEDRKKFLLCLICFAACIEGLFFFAALAYVYFLRSKGLLHGLASGTNWVFRDESCHMNFAFAAIDVIRAESPELFDQDLEDRIIELINDAIDAEEQFAVDLLSGGVVGLNAKDMRKYLEYVADQRFARLGINYRFGSKNPFAFMELQDVQELTNFFERRVSAYQSGVTGTVDLNDTSF
jgi:ribonucleoside-diphosphate reductase beta chain